MTQDRPNPLRRASVLGAAFVSGFAIMCIEMLGARILAPYFGSSVYVWGSIIAVFMLSLAFGYLLGGRLSARHPNPITYALFFVGAALFSLPIVLVADSVMELIFDQVADPRYGSLLAAILLYFVPICIMGMISPYSVRLLVENEQQSGSMTGLLFFTSTLGSFLGTILTSFYFVLWFEVNTIMWGSAGALLAAAIAVVTIHGRPTALPATARH